jgi:hypothetical protein
MNKELCRFQSGDYWLVTRVQLTAKTEGLGETPVPVPLCLSQVSWGETWTRTHASAERSRDYPALCCAVSMPNCWKYAVSTPGIRPYRILTFARLTRLPTQEVGSARHESQGLRARRM